MPEWLNSFLEAASSIFSALVLAINQNAPVSFWIGALLCVTYLFRRETLRKFWQRVERGDRAFPPLKPRDRIAYFLSAPLLLPEKAARVIIGPEDNRGGPRTIIAALLVLLLAVAVGMLSVILWKALIGTPAVPPPTTTTPAA